jgi:hypothetical protein
MKSWPIHKLIAGGATLAVLWMTASQLALYRDFSAVRYWFGAVEESRAVSLPILEGLSSDTRAIVSRNVCQSRIIKPALALSLSELDALAESGDASVFDKTLEASFRLASHAVSCLPTNGNFRLRLAMIEQARAGFDAKVQEQFYYSQLYAPAEQASIQGRIALALKLPDDKKQDVHMLLSQDAKALCATAQGRWMRPEFSTEKRTVVDALPEQLHCLP